ncbi:hypothetical protein LG198_05180 [Methylobacillus arboreus]|uniref:hypothetical protein n=1 Tax=Methylobacillus arboreus TaxID=755170 RepID=UPI001E620667|nr:hypothetical protein [Methylobacillus arboreus]MCB5190114.1 hypothetical protein [Methylobacillus arboreus]
MPDDSFPPALHAWEQTMDRANAAFERQDIQAEEYYRQALEIAESAMVVCCRHAGEACPAYCDAVIAAFVISHHNLAGLYRQQGAELLAETHYLAALKKVSALCEDDSLGDLPQLASRHMTRVLGEYVSYQQLRGRYSANPGQGDILPH